MTGQSSPSNRGESVQWTRWTRRLAPALVLGVLAAARLDAQVFLRGDANSDGRVSGSDAHFVLGFLFVGREPPQCMRAADTDGDGQINITDSITLLNFLALGGTPPCLPFPEPGEDGQTDPPCGEVTVRPPLEDPEARIRISNAIAGPDGRTVLNVFTTNAVEIAGYFATIRLEGARFGATTQVTDLSETLSGGFVSAAVFDGRIRIGFLSAIIPQAFIPPGDDQPVLQIDVCLEGGLEPGDYQMAVEAAELVDFETGQAILPGTEADVLAVPAALADTGCVSNPEPEVTPRECPGRPGPPDPPDPPEPPVGLTLDFARGDANLDGSVSMADSLTLRRFLFIGGAFPPCLDATDATDDGGIDLTDMVFILNHLFLGGATPPAPFLEPGPDPTLDSLGCDSDTIVPPDPAREDAVILGEVDALAGQTVAVPVLLTNRAEIEGFQLVIRSEPPLFRPVGLDPNVPGGVFRGADDAFFRAARPLPGGSGVSVVGFIPDLIRDLSVPPGEGQLVFAILGEVALDAAPGTVLELVFVDEVAIGDSGALLRNELISRGEPRFPELVAGRIRITGGVAILRGDTNHSGAVDLSDSVALLNHLFASGESPPCADEADANDDGRLNIADAIAILNALFEGGPPIPPPFPGSGADPTDDDLPECGAGAAE